jgi:hypothetical protein
VGYGRLDAQLTPCQLRCALLAGPDPGPGPGLPRLVDAITAVEVGAGLDHLGGGLYGRGNGAVGSERWFVSTLTHDEIARLIAAPPQDLAHEECGVTLTPDAELATTTVRVASSATAPPAHPARLDEVAFWVLSACLVGELDTAVRRTDG